MRVRLARWLDTKDERLSWPRLFMFYKWVLTPRSYGEHYGFRNWFRWAFLRARDE